MTVHFLLRFVAHQKCFWVFLLQSRTMAVFSILFFSFFRCTPALSLYIRMIRLCKILDHWSPRAIPIVTIKIIDIEAEIFIK